MRRLEIGQVRDWTGLVVVGHGEKWADLRAILGLSRGIEGEGGGNRRSQLSQILCETLLMSLAQSGKLSIPLPGCSLHGEVLRSAVGASEVL